MESSRNASGLQSWEAYFPGLTRNPRAGQREVFEVAANEDVRDRLVVLPTGYGKTFAGLGYYAIRRGRGLVNRCLWIVSSDEQREQLSPLPTKDGRRGITASDLLSTWFGLGCLETDRADGSTRCYRMHLTDRAEIFVTTYQTILHNTSDFRELLDDAGGRWQWQVIGDEAHHLSEDGKWAAKLAELPRVETLYLSATPVRTDRRPLRNVPSDGTTYDARVEIPWQDAIDEGAIREPRAHAQEWRLQFEDQLGNDVTITTSELRDAGVNNEATFDEYRVRHDLRYKIAYLDKIFLDALNRLNEKRVRWPGRHQMLVYAMSCSHASFLASQVFGRLIDTDWIGVTRSDAENKAVLTRYKQGALSVLVQVDKVGEGFDHPPASVALFLNLIQSEAKLLQQLGRVLRRDAEIPKPQDWADVFADTAHPVIEVVRKLEPDDKSIKEAGEGNEGGERDASWEPMPDVMEIDAQWQQTQLVFPDGLARHYEPGVLRAAERHGLSPEQVEEIIREVQGAPAATPATPAQAVTGEVQRQALYQDRVNRAVRSVTGHAMSLLIARNGAVSNPNQLAGQIKKRLHKQWIKVGQRGHDEMLSEDFASKYAWLKEVDEAMRQTREVPAWLSQDW